MKTLSSDLAAKSIEMSPGAKAKWLKMLKTRKINTAKQILSRVRDLHGEPAARKALNGERLDRTTWDSIFKGLRVFRDDFFNDIEWFDRNLESQWGLLWEMAKDASDRFGIVLPENIPDSSAWDGVGSDKFQQSIESRTSVLLEIPWSFALVGAGCFGKCCLALSVAVDGKSVINRQNSTLTAISTVTI
jgi:hypothetical protein